MYALFAEALQENKPLPDEKTFTTHHEQDIVKRATDLLTSPYTLSPTWAKHNIQVAQVKEQLDRHARQLLLHFKLKHVQALQEKVLKQLQENQEEENYLITRYMQLGKAKRYFADQLGMVII
jgi:DNA primase